ncbi:Mis12-Mtw1 protein family-domain-containing protein [Mycena galericulata]|nr:Mis12-Mtw1 protein family-domain-containing protein [Mycena galericulata]
MSGSIEQYEPRPEYEACDISPTRRPDDQFDGKAGEAGEPYLAGARNKVLRGDAMTAIANDANNARTPEPDPKAHRRRSSLGGRGHRISSSFREGAFTLPHPRVNEESFYKHVDRDVPSSEQLRQMLVWCASRAAGAPSSDLPPDDGAALQTVQQDMMRRLAERRIDLSLSRREDHDMDATVKGKNAQNEKNMRWEHVYSKEIQEAEAELEEWKRTQFRWEEYVEKQKKGTDGIRRARANQSKLPDERFLDERIRRGLQLARAPPNPAAAKLRAALPNLTPALNALHTDLYAARTAVRVAGRVLDARFGVLGAGLNACTGTAPEPADAGGLLRALARVDAAAPPERVGDEVRQAAREVQRAMRAGEGGASGSTPPRAGTPRRERTPVR